MTRVPLVGVVVAALGAVQTPAPPIQNGRIDVRPGTAIDREVASVGAGADAVWLGWRVPAAEGHQAGCCVYNDDFRGAAASVRGCFVENPTAGDRALPQIAVASSPVPLEAGTGLVILLRVVDGHVERIRSLGDDCPLDAGGRTVYWMPNVAAAESVRFLAAVVNADAVTRAQQQRLRDAALSAIAQHQDPSAVTVLLGIARNDVDPNRRAEAAYWLGQRGGSAVVKDVLALIGSDAADVVKRRSVEGLARLPDAESTPLLLDLARTSSTLVVKKAAVAALGRSKDPRAGAYLESLLK
jgi:hypothetical protein